MKHELTRLRSLVIGLAGTDEEGAYRPEFVERMLKAAQEKPKHVFQDAESFLDQLRST